MSLRPSILILFACFLASGCRKDPYVDAYFDMLNAEKRQLEDRIYELEYDHEKALKELERQRSKAKDKSGSKTTTRKAAPEKIQETEESPEEEPQGPKVEFPKGFNAPTDKQTSALELNAPANRSQGKVRLASAKKAAEEEPGGESEDQAANAAAPPAASEPTGGTQRVDYIYLNPRQTGGQDFDQQAGDDGLSVLIEPRNRDGEFVPQPAKVSIVVLDPTKSGAAARVGRWDFEKDVAAKVLRNSPLDRGLHFRFPWPAEPPEHERLQLFVRYWCDDGRKLEAERLITVRVPGQNSQAWARRLGRADQAGGTPNGTRTTVTGTPPQTPTLDPAKAGAGLLPPAGAGSDAQFTAERPGRFWKPSR